MNSRSFLLALAVASVVALLALGGQSMAEKDTKEAAMTTEAASKARAILAGGCFWCMEKPFEQLEGVSAVISGYTGGEEVDPTYKQVASGRTGHLEAVEIHFDPAIISYEKLLEVFWQQINPTDAGGQFVDRGPQYATGIFVLDEEQRRIAEASKKALDASGRYDAPVITPILEAKTFYRAEEYHQDYYKKSPIRYKFYRRGSGRDQYLQKIWGK